MKRVVRIMVATAITLVPFVVSDSAFAGEACQVGYTGPDSNNECTLTSTYTCTIKNNDDFDIKNENDQVAGSGTAKSTNNTSAGAAETGSATNSNDTSINVGINNGGSGKLCAIVKPVPAKITPAAPSAPPTAPSIPPTAPSVPPTAPSPPQKVTPPGKGAIPPVVTQTVPVPQKAAPPVLPPTSGDELAALLTPLTGLLAASTVVTRLAVTTYGRFKS